MKWILKAIVQKLISWLPGSQKINYLFQKHVTKGVQLSDQYFSDKLGHAIDHLRFYKKHGGQENFKALELGSGWYPVVPVALFLAGAGKIISIDISPLMNAQGIRETISKYLQWYEAGKLEKLKPFINEERLQSLRDLKTSELSKEELLRTLNIRLMIRDARSTGFDDNEFDLVCSNNTYEHIYPQILKDIIREFQRIVKPGGVNSHFIDMSDHFAHLDNSITIYNYLQFSEKQWALIDNSVQPQNRMRLPQYEAVYSDLSIEIIEKEIRPGSIEEFKKLKLSDPYKAYPAEAAAISHAHLVSSK